MYTFGFNIWTDGKSQEVFHSDYAFNTKNASKSHKLMRRRTKKM